MRKINWYLKHTFIAFNILFAILGCVFIVLAIKSGIYSHEFVRCILIDRAMNFSEDRHQPSAVGSPNLVWIWVFAIGVLSISCLGISAGYSEKEIILKIFAGFMVVGMIIMLIFGIIMVVERNKGVRGPHRIYAEPSSEVMFIFKDSDFKTTMNIYFGFAVIALLSLLLSVLMIHQIRRRNSSGGTSIAMRVY